TIIRAMRFARRVSAAIGTMGRTTGLAIGIATTRLRIRTSTIARVYLIILSLFRTLYSLPLGKNQSPRSGLVTTVESPEDIRKKAENEACRIYIRKDMRY
ncbi:MAG: hypothetical protein ACI4N6_04145, partial [Eubacteriales bacterium]